MTLACAVMLGFATASAAQDIDTWYDIVELNPGLGDPPKGVDRSTPQGTIESFVDAIRSRDWNVAAHLLDLSAVDPADQPVQGPRLAQFLGEVLERRLWIDWADLPDRPDALIENGSDKNPLAGKPRRNLRLAIVDLNDRTIGLRLNRVKPEDGEPVWVFARQTVANIEALHARYGPGWFERRLPASLRDQSYFSLRVWELIAFPTLVVLAALIFLLTRQVFGYFAVRTSWTAARNAALAARTPLALFAAGGFLTYLTTGLLGFSAPITAVLSPILLICMVAAIAIALLRAIDSLLDIVTEKYVGEIDDEQSTEQRSLYTSVYAVRRIVLLVAVLLATGVVLTQLHVFETLGISLLASAGVLTVILGIAGQNILGNILASLQIALAKPIRIGDSVSYEGDWAYVEAIFYTFVRLRTWDNRRLIVPVKYFVSKPFENWSIQDSKMTRTFTLVVDHRADVEKLRRTFLELAAADDDVIDPQEAKALVIDHDHAGAHIRFYATSPDPSAAWDMHARLRERMIAWINEHHPEWWPRERILDVTKRNTAASGPVHPARIIGDLVDAD